MRSVIGSNAENAFPKFPLPTAFHVDLCGSTHSVVPDVAPALALVGGNVRAGKLIAPARRKDKGDVDDNVGLTLVLVPKSGLEPDLGLELELAFALPDADGEGSDKIKSATLSRSAKSKSERLELFDEYGEAENSSRVSIDSLGLFSLDRS